VNREPQDYPLDLNVDVDDRRDCLVEWALTQDNL
jgi:hypothetical protein